MDKDWLPLVHHTPQMKNSDSYSNLLALMNRIESEKGTRFTQEQADVVQKLIAVLIDEIRAYKSHKKN